MICRSLSISSSSVSYTHLDVYKRQELDNLRRVEGELEWFTLKFDYRNADKPWGNSHDAVERGINKLMGACVGEEAQLPPHND